MTSSAHPITSVPNFLIRALPEAVDQPALCLSACVFCVAYSYLHVCLLVVQERSVCMCVCVRACVCKRQHQPMGVVLESVSVD